MKRVCGRVTTIENVGWKKRQFRQRGKEGLSLGRHTDYRMIVSFPISEKTCCVNVSLLSFPFVSGFSHLRWQKSLSHGRQRKRRRPSCSSLSVFETLESRYYLTSKADDTENNGSLSTAWHMISHLALVTFADSAMSERMDSFSCQLAKHSQSSSHASLLFLEMIVHSRIWMAWNCRRKERKWRETPDIPSTLSPILII